MSTDTLPSQEDIDSLNPEHDAPAPSNTVAQLKDISWQGLWQNNPALVQLLGLCPLLAVTASVVNALGLGIATTLVLIASNTSVSAIRHWIPKEIRIPVFVMIIAAFVTSIELIMNAWLYDLYLSLGIFIPLIVTNCAIIGRAEAFASKNPIKWAAFDGLMMGLGFTLVLILLGAIREVLGNGTLFDGAQLLLGPWAQSLRIDVFQFDSHFLLAILPPGAFIGMGFIIAAKNVIDQYIEKRKQALQPKKVVTRARVTGVNSDN